MAHTKGLLQNQQQAISKRWRDEWRCTWQRLVFVVILTGLCGMMLTGCQDFWDTTAKLLRIDGGNDGGNNGGNGDAEAQEPTVIRIKTYTINAEGFEIRLDNDTDPTPTLDDAADNSTRLTMRSEGFLVRGTGDSNIPLEEGDIIILRLDGSTGSVTLIHAD